MKLDAIGDVGYGGPLESVGNRMHYSFWLLALDNALQLGAGAYHEAFDTAAEGHVIDSAELSVQV